MATESMNFGHDRRKFVVGATTATLALAAGGLSGFSLLSRDGGVGSDRALAPEDLGYELLAPIVGEQLQFRVAARRMVALVTSVSEPMHYRTDDGISGSAFSVILESTAQIEQGIREFAHTRLGAFALFVVPVGLPAGRSFVYEAVLNRLD